MKCNEKLYIALAFLLITNLNTLFSQEVIQPNVVILDTTASQFWADGEKQGWKKNHIAISDSKVTSINFLEEVRVFSKDGTFLFYMPQTGATWARIKGYLQLAVFDQQSKKIAWLGKTPITDIVPAIPKEDAAPVILLNLTRAEFSAKANKIGWTTNTTVTGANQVASINYFLYAPVYSKDGFLMFYLIKSAVSYAIEQGYIELANYDGKTTIKRLGKIPFSIKK